jgi:hypothetical protein
MNTFCQWKIEQSRFPQLFFKFQKTYNIQRNSRPALVCYRADGTVPSSENGGNISYDEGRKEMNVGWHLLIESKALT